MTTTLPETCDDCGAVCVRRGCGAGYARTPDNRIVCYPCAAQRVRHDFARDRRGVAYVSSCGRYVITWSGERLGTVYLGAGWPVHSYIGSRMYQAYAWIDGRQYTGRTFGAGTCVSLRETARSRKRAA